MKMLKLTCILVLAISMMHCNKSEDEVTVQDGVILHYNQTKCADQWSANQNNTDEEIIASVKTFFETEYQINLDNLNIIDGNNGQDCEACNCLTGRVITVSVAEQFYDDLVTEGFFTP